MSEVEFLPFQFEHLIGFEPGFYDRQVLTVENINCLEKDWPDKALTAKLNERTLGFAGASLEGSRALAWMVLSDEMRNRYPVLLHKIVTSCLKDLARLDGAETIEVTVHPDFEKSKKWFERLGFEPIDVTEKWIRYNKYVT